MIRLANKDDLAGILKLYNELRPSDPTLPESLAIERWQQIINDDRTHIVVADINGTLAATCALSINLSIAVSARPFGLIEHVVTRRDFRRQGLSQQVLSYVIDYFHRIYISIRSVQLLCFLYSHLVYFSFSSVIFSCLFPFS